MSMMETTRDDVFDALSDRHRRRLLLALRAESDSNDPKMDIDGLVEAVATGGGTDPVRIQLFHIHLPKLADSGYIRWDSNAGTITTGPRWDSLESVLDVLVENRDKLPDDSL